RRRSWIPRKEVVCSLLRIRSCLLVSLRRDSAQPAPGLIRRLRHHSRPKRRNVQAQRSRPGSHHALGAKAALRAGQSPHQIVRGAHALKRPGLVAGRTLFTTVALTRVTEGHAIIDDLDDVQKRTMTEGE